MSFQAYLDAIELRNGKTPAELLTEAAEHGFDAATKAAPVLEWLKTDHGIGRGHVMALYHVLKNGTEISDKHLDTGRAHSDPSTTLRIDGLTNR